MGECGRKNQKKYCLSLGLNSRPLGEAKKLMYFQLKLYYWATENDSLLLLDWNLYVFISILLMQVQKGKSKQK